MREVINGRDSKGNIRLLTKLHLDKSSLRLPTNLNTYLADQQCDTKNCGSPTSLESCTAWLRSVYLMIGEGGAQNHHADCITMHS